MSLSAKHPIQDLINIEHNDDAEAKNVVALGKTNGGVYVPIQVGSDGSIMADYLKLDASNGPITADLGVTGNIITNDATPPTFAKDGVIVAYDPNSNATQGSLVHVQIPDVPTAFGGFSLSYGTTIQWLFGISKNATNEKTLTFFEDATVSKIRMELVPGGGVNFYSGVLDVVDAGIKTAGSILTSGATQWTSAGDGSISITSDEAGGVGTLFHAEIPDLAGKFGGISMGYGANNIKWLVGMSKNSSDTTAYSWFEDGAANQERLRLSTGGGLGVPQDLNALTFGLADDVKMEYDGNKFNITLDAVGTNEMTIGDGGVINYAEINSTGDMYFVGTGGLLFGVMYLSAELQVVISDANPTEVKGVLGNGWTVGELNEVTFPDIPDQFYLTISKAGRYEVNYNLSIKSGTAGTQQIHAGIMIDAVAQRNCGESHRTVSNANDTGNISSVCILDCPNGTEKISLWILNSASNDTNATHGTMTIKQIGGT